MERKDEALGVWGTPPDLFAYYDQEFHFTLDVCALPANARCPAYFSPADDGLRQSWSGTCWCNPPYGHGQLKFWVKKAYQEAQAGATVVMLIPARTNETWWHRYCLRAAEVRFFLGGLKFTGMDSALACLPLCLVVFRPGCQGPPTVSTAAKIVTGRRRK